MNHRTLCASGTRAVSATIVPNRCIATGASRSGSSHSRSTMPRLELLALLLACTLVAGCKETKGSDTSVAQPSQPVASAVQEPLPAEAEKAPSPAAKEERFTYTNNGAEVKDSVTGLIWKRCLEGMNWSGTACTGEALQLDRATALSHAKDQSDWRLPSVEELESILEEPPKPATIDATAFPNTQKGWHWSSSRVVYDTNSEFGWAVFFGAGYVGDMRRHEGTYVRLVRGQALPVPEPRFTYLNDGAEVQDNKSGLIWKRCAEGMQWNGTTCTGKAAQYSYEKVLSHVQNQTGWRLPNSRELSAISDKRKTDPAIDKTAFPKTPPEHFWSTSPSFHAETYMLVVSFGGGGVYESSPDKGNHLRLVRDGQNP